MHASGDEHTTGIEATPGAPDAGPGGERPRLPRERLGRWWLSLRAVLRWIERYAPEASYPEGFRQLAAISESAVLVEGAKRPDGKSVYTHPDQPLARFVVADDGRRAMPTLVTILDASPHGTHRGMFSRERRPDNPRRRDGRTHRRGGRERR